MSRECQIVRILQARVAAGDATPKERAQIDAHLRSCKVCGGRLPTPAPRQRREEAREIKAPPSAPVEPAGAASRARPAWKHPTLLVIPLLLAGIWFLATRDGADDGDAPGPSDPTASTAAPAPDVVSAMPSPELEAAAGLAAAEIVPDDRNAEPLPVEAAAGHEPEPAPAIEPKAEPTLGAAEEPAVVPAAGPAEEPVVVPAAGAAEEPAVVPAAGPPEEPVVVPAAGPAEEPRPGPATEPEPAALDAAHIEAMRSAGDCAGLEAAAQAVTHATARAELLLAAGTCKQAAGDPQGALGLFDLILTEHKETPSAEAATFERGVACEAAGRPGTAVGAFATYRREYPNAPRVAEALFRLCRLHVSGRRFEQAIACARRFRDRYPSDEHVAQTHYLEGLALKEQSETLVQAAESFARYAASSDTEHLDDALYWRASCLRDAKDARQADAARAYLERLPAGERAAEVRGWLDGG